MDWFPLSLFPEGALASSVVTTIWIGVWVVAFFNLRFGWVLSGLVIPGYLVPLMMIKPWAALAIFIEGCVTYFLVWLFSEQLSRVSGWSNLFGRDRFFALVLVSIGVRLVFDLWFFPEIGMAINHYFGADFDFSNNFHSFGLIIVSLVANNFWKTGFRRGIVPMITIVTITALIIRYGLMEWTNFSFSNLSFMYETLAESIESTPKAYIILLTTAFIASRMNLLYGWDYNGILIPSLLALQWYQPQKILTSFVEAGVILAIGVMVLKAPIFRRITMEGARKLLLFFNISFIYKIVLGYAILRFEPSLKITDYYGFGYLLPTLLAVKIHDKNIFYRLTRASVETSLIAALVATGFGFLLTYLPDPNFTLSTPLRTLNAETQRLPTGATLIDAVRANKLALYAATVAQKRPMPTEADIQTFGLALEELLVFQDTGDRQRFDRAKELFFNANYTLRILENRYLFLDDNNAARSGGTFVFTLNSRNDLAIQLASPLGVSAVLESGVALFQELESRALLIAGARRARIDSSVVEDADLSHAFFRLVHSRLAGSLLTVHGHDLETDKALLGIGLGARNATSESANSLWVQKALPESLNLARLRALVGEFEIHWQDAGLQNITSVLNSRGAASLVISQNSARQLLAASIRRHKVQDSVAEVIQSAVSVESWLASKFAAEAAPTSASVYREPTLEELAFFDAEVINPLIAYAYSNMRTPTTSDQKLDYIDGMASLMGYRIVGYHDTERDQHFIILLEDTANPKRRNWGTLVQRLGASADYMLEVPRMAAEARATSQALKLFDTIRARYLILNGLGSAVNADASLFRKHDSAFFNLLHQVILREWGRDPAMVIQLREFAAKNEQPFPTSEALLASINLDVTAETRSLVDNLKDILQQRLELGVVDGDLGEEELGIGQNPQFRYFTATANKVFGVLWISSLAFPEPMDSERFNRSAIALNAIGVNAREGLLSEMVLAAKHRRERDILPNDMLSMLANYGETSDIVVLSKVRDRWPNYNLIALYDSDSKRPYLLVYSPHDVLLAVVDLLATADARGIAIDGPPSKDKVAQFVDARIRWLTLGTGSK